MEGTFYGSCTYLLFGIRILEFSTSSIRIQGALSYVYYEAYINGFFYKAFEM